VKNSYLIIIITALLIWGCASQKTQVIALQQHIEGMRADSLLLEKRIEKLKEENAYL
jgi:cell division protein FtsB